MIPNRTETGDGILLGQLPQNNGMGRAIVDGDPFEDVTVIGKTVDALFMDGRLVINNCGLEV